MPRAPRRCGKAGCDNQMPCQRHKPVDTRASGSVRYPKKHQDERAEWAPVVATGTVVCRRAQVEPSQCLRTDRYIDAAEGWDLGHPDQAVPLPTAPEHWLCNRSAGGSDWAKSRRAGAR